MASNKAIVALSDFEHVLTRPEMYISSIIPSEEKVQIIRDGKVIWETREISVGFYKLMNEIVDNAFDESKRMKGQMKEISVYFDSKSGSVKVIDTGGGFLNASHINTKTNLPNVETAMSLLRAGSNFKNENTTENLIGTNGVGASVVNMLSDRFFIRTINSEEIYEQEWIKFSSNGPKVTKRIKERTGTEIVYVPRKDKFKNCFWDKEYVHTLMLFRQYLKNNDPEISSLKFSCFFDNEKLDLDQNFIPEEHIVISNRYGKFVLWESYPNSANLSFINGALCTGVQQKIFGEYVNTIFENPVAGRFYESLSMLNLPPKYVRFGDQNKTRFVTSRGEIFPILEKNFFPGIKREIRNSVIFDNILKKIAAAERESDVRNIRTKKRLQKQKISEKYFPSSEKTKNLFLVEGSSAAGSIAQERDSKTDALYALKGKVKNARRLSDLTNNMEIIELMNILNLDPENDKNCKFEKIIIATDADPDGNHISSLIINLFYRWFPNVIRQGKLFILQTPLVSVTENGKMRYFFNTLHFEKYVESKKPQNVRYLKGLGSLSIDDWTHVFSEMQLLKIKEDTYSTRMLDIAFGSNANLRKKWLSN